MCLSFGQANPAGASPAIPSYSPPSGKGSLHLWLFLFSMGGRPSGLIASLPGRRLFWRIISDAELIMQNPSLEERRLAGFVSYAPPPDCILMNSDCLPVSERSHLHIH